LLSRSDGIQAITESFVYDSLNRVTSSTVAPVGQSTVGTTVSVAYDAQGNITSKSDIGAGTYGPGTGCSNAFADPHAVSIVNGAKVASYCYDPRVKPEGRLPRQFDPRRRPHGGFVGGIAKNRGFSAKMR